MLWELNRGLAWKVTSLLTFFETKGRTLCLIDVIRIKGSLVCPFFDITPKRVTFEKVCHLQTLSILNFCSIFLFEKSAQCLDLWCKLERMDKIISILWWILEKQSSRILKIEAGRRRVKGKVLWQTICLPQKHNLSILNCSCHCFDGII